MWHVFGNTNTERLMCEHKGERQLGRPKREWENIIIDLNETEKEGVDWIEVSQDGAKCRNCCEQGNEASVFFCFVLYGCGTWSLILREVCRLRVFENRRLRRVFGPKRDEGTGKLRRLRNEELCALYSSPNTIRLIKSRRLRWAWHVACMK
jgi:hypothetical protein